MMLSYETSQMIMMISIMINVTLIVALINVSRDYLSKVEMIEAKDTYIAVLNETTNRFVMMELKKILQQKEEEK